MKFLFRAAVVLFFLAVAVKTPAEVLTARDVIETQKNLHHASTARDNVVMILVDENDERKIRHLVRSAKEDDDGLVRTLLVFSEPSEIRETALLTREISEGQYKQWIYFPGDKSLQRIADKTQQTSFMGSDFTYEDLQPRSLNDYTYTFAPEEGIDGQPCFVIDIEPATKQVKRASAYSRIRAWVRKDIFFTVKTEFFDHRSRLFKTQTAYELENSHEKAWYAKKVLMENHLKSHKTLMGVTSKQVNLPLDDEVFSENYILLRKHL
jgi:hypothetical protein